MAEINLKRKKRSIWPWIVGLILAILVMWVILKVLREDKAVEVEEVSSFNTNPADTLPAVETGTTATAMVYSNIVLISRVNAFAA